MLDGLSYAALLFLVALGMTLVFGVMNIVNMAHGSFYALGAYAAASFVGWASAMKWAPGYTLAFLIGHLVAIRLYRQHRRAAPAASQRAAALALLILTPLTAFLLGGPLVALYALGLGGMAATAWLSSFSRYRVGLGAVMFVISDLLIFARMGPLAASALPGASAGPSFLACPVPVIAAINGAAVGIGATMTLAMDVRMASEKARMGFVFGKLGIVPEACSSWFLPRLVGPQQALEWVLSADIFDAEEGCRGGLFRSVHAPEALLDDARALARKFIQNRSPVAVALARQMMWRNAAQPHPIEAHRIDSLAMFYTSMADGKEGVAAFLEKRDPVFTGKASQMPAFYPWQAD